MRVSVIFITIIIDMIYFHASETEFEIVLSYLLYSFKQNATAETVMADMGRTAIHHACMNVHKHRVTSVEEIITTVFSQVGMNQCFIYQSLDTPKKGYIILLRSQLTSRSWKTLSTVVVRPQAIGSTETSGVKSFKNHRIPRIAHETHGILHDLSVAIENLTDSVSSNFRSKMADAVKTFFHDKFKLGLLHYLT